MFSLLNAAGLHGADSKPENVIRMPTPDSKADSEAACVPLRQVLLDGAVYGAAGAVHMREAIATADLAVLALRHIEAL